MGKVKIKRKSTLIDMTAMSDVTVLLLTFFMLTSTFLAKEPTVVNTPSSVSEEKVPMYNLVTILVSGKDKPGKEGNPATEGKVFISFCGDQDSTYSSEKVRELVLKEAVGMYNKEHPSNQITLTDQEVNTFKSLNMFGVPFAGLKQYLALDQEKRDKFQGNMADPAVGIPIDDNKDYDKGLNDFQIWMKAVYFVSMNLRDEQVGNLGIEKGSEEDKQMQNLYNALKRNGQAIAVKADKNTPYSTVQKVFDNLQTMKLNKFTLMTALKSEEEQSN